MYPLEPSLRDDASVLIITKEGNFQLLYAIIVRKHQIRNEKDAHVMHTTDGVVHGMLVWSHYSALANLTTSSSGMSQRHLKWRPRASW